jgi:hypothetical protein
VDKTNDHTGKWARRRMMRRSVQYGVVFVDQQVGNLIKYAVLGAWARYRQNEKKLTVLRSPFLVVSE